MNTEYGKFFENKQDEIAYLEKKVRKMVKAVDTAYADFGRHLHDLTDQEFGKIDDMVDQIAQMNKRLAALKEGAEQADP